MDEREREREVRTGMGGNWAVDQRKRERGLWKEKGLNRPVQQKERQSVRKVKVHVRQLARQQKEGEGEAGRVKETES